MAATSTSLGPYTAWMYGPGRSYDFFATDGAREDYYLSGVLERPGGHTATVDPNPLSAGGTVATLYAPTLWSGLASPRFVPFVMAGQMAQGMDAPTLDALWQSADGAGVHMTGGGGLGPAAGSETRINAGLPVRKSTVVEAASGNASLSKDPAVDPTKPLVVIGIIDDGIPFANRAFDGPDGRTRVDACWMQGAAHDGSGSVRFGREVTADDIMALRATEPDEDAIYRRAGALAGPSSLIGDVAHGAHTLGALAEDSDVQVRIIAVDLPPAATWDTSGYGKDMAMIAALHYIFDRADKLAAAYGIGPLPMVVNVSYGYAGGAHDGSTITEAAFDELVEARRAVAPTGLTLPAGNMFLDATHAAVTVTAGAAMDPLPWRVQPNDRTSTFLECWLPAGASPDDVTLTLHGPGATYGAPGPVAGTLAGGNAAGTRLTPITWNGATVGQLSVDQGRSGRWRYLVALAPTESSQPDHAPAGLWKVVAQNSSGAELSLRFWIQRDLSYGRSSTGARQSYFDEPANARWTREGRINQEDTPGAMTQRHGTLNGMATGTTGLVVGAAKGREIMPEPYTASSLPGDARQVDLSAVVTAHDAEVGRLGLTTRSGGKVRLTGTSISAPVTGARLRDVIAAQPVGPSADNYASAAPGLQPLSDQQRLGKGALR